MQDLTDIYEYIVAKSNKLPDVAMTYIQKLKGKCEDLSTFPLRGNQRHDIRKNWQLIQKTVLTFHVEEDKQTVTILNIFYGGSDYETLIASDE